MYFHQPFLSLLEFMREEPVTCHLFSRHNEPKPGHCIYYKYGRRVKSMYSRLIIDGNAVYEIDEGMLKAETGKKGVRR